MRRVGAIVFIVFSAISTYSEVLVLDEETAAALAVSRDAGAATARIDAAAGERRVSNANNFLLPLLTASIGATEEFSSAADATTEGVMRLSSGLSFSASDFKAKETTARRSSQLGLEAREAEERIGKEARKAFYRLILLSDQVTLAEGSVEVVREGAERTAEEYRNGLSSERVKRQSEVALEIEKLALERIRTERAVAKAGFLSLLGLDTGSRLELTGSLETSLMAVDRSMLSDLSSRTDLALVDARRSVQESLVAEDRLARRVPTLTLAATASAAVADLFPGTDAEPLADRVASGSSISLTLSSPNLSAFLPFSRETEATTTLTEAAVKLDIERTEILRRARIETETLLAEIEVSRSALESLRASLSLAEEVLALTREAYAVGAASYQDLRTAEKDLDRARFDLLSERYSYLSKVIDLEYAVGRRLRAAKE